MSLDAAIENDPTVAERSDHEKERLIRQEIAHASAELRQRFGLLNHQNTIGLGIALGLVSLSVLLGYGYWSGVLPAWVVVVCMVFVQSFFHEMEHDTIHKMYFPRDTLLHRVIRSFIFACCWLGRPMMVNPWKRMSVHLEHHKHSGTTGDPEQAFFGIGMPVYKRFILQMDFFATQLLYALPRAVRERRTGEFLTITLAWLFPIGLIGYALWYLFLFVHGVDAVSTIVATGATTGRVAWPAYLLEAMPVINLLGVVLLLPYFVRMVFFSYICCFIHYHDVEADNVMQQTQVVNSRRFWLCNLLCFNVGVTHSIHHFYVPDPFYIREAVSAAVLPTMRELGVRFNDTGYASRLGRFALTPTDDAGTDEDVGVAALANHKPRKRVRRKPGKADQK